MHLYQEYFGPKNAYNVTRLVTAWCNHLYVLSDGLRGWVIVD